MEEKERLRYYAVIERLYNKISKKVNYCIPQCISKEISKYIDKKKGYFGCCTINYENIEKKESFYNKTIEILREKRITVNPNLKNIKNQSNELETSCYMHTKEKGCIIDKYKPLLCVSFFCESFENNLCKKYGLDIIKKMKDNVDRYFFLDDLLNGKLKKNEVDEYRKDLISIIKIIKEKNNTYIKQ